MLGRGLLLVVIFVGVALASGAAVLKRGSRSGCSLGFLQHKKSCYLFSEITAPYGEAFSFCRYFGGKLAEINSKDEYNFIAGHLKRKGEGYSYYIGGTDLRVEGIWTWENPVRKISYSNWYPGEPNNGGKKEHCLDLYKRAGYKMNDCPCNTLNRFVCEKHM